MMSVGASHDGGVAIGASYAGSLVLGQYVQPQETQQLWYQVVNALQSQV